MKSTLTRTVVATALITAASGAFAHEDYSESGATHWLEHVQASSSQPSERQLSRYGYASSTTPVRGVIVREMAGMVDMMHFLVMVVGWFSW